VIVLPYLEYVPRIAPDISADRWSAIIGRSEVGAGCYLGPLATLRADGEVIRVGPSCWLGEASTVHIADTIFATRIGSHVTLGRYGLIHACTVGDDCVVGEHAVVMDGAEVGPGAVIASESVVPPGKKLEGGWLYAGTPARPVEAISSARLEALHRAIRSTAAGDGGAWSRSTEVVRAKNPVHALRHPPGSGIANLQAEATYIAPSACIAGQLELAPHSSIWFGVEIDADGALVQLGEASNIQDNSRLYLAPGERVRIGRRVTVGHNVRMYACDIEDGAVIGMGSIIGKGTVVRAGGCVAAGAITEPGTEVTAGYIWSGQPARGSRPLSAENRDLFSLGVDIYVQYSQNYRLGRQTGGAI
jgi:carbonic anhydrase/acetyltransferase-like protein (isoleucine patch superfamily)